MKRRTLIASVVLVSFVFISASMRAQTTYHLHKDSNVFLLKTAGPDTASTSVQSANLKNQAVGEYLVKDFVTQAGVPNASGAIPANSNVTFTLWMKKTANVGTLFPRAKLFLNSAAGPQLCTATGTTAITTTLSSYTFTCTTGGDISINTSSRYYLWVGVNLTGTGGSNFNAELDIEGTLNGNFDSRIVVPAIMPPPTITNITPTSGRPGTSVTITGTNFGSTQGTVRFPSFDSGFRVWPITSWSSTTIVTAVGDGMPGVSNAGSGSVFVTTAAGTSNGVAFTVDTTPHIDNISPSSGIVGTVVTITGSNFFNCPSICFPEAAEVPTVTFSGISTDVIDYSDTVVNVAVPTGSTTGNVVVINHNSTPNPMSSNGVLFTVLQPPAITSLSPTSGGVGTSVTITGTNFGASQGSSTVSFNGTAATPQSPSDWSDTSIVVPVPSAATTGNVTVTTAGGTSNGVSFTVSSAPQISSLSPSAGVVGTTVTINGSNFGATQGTSSIAFNGVAATPTNWTNSAITAGVPAAATSGNVTVTTTQGTSNGLSFTVTPVITEISPTSGLPGSVLVVNGSGFGSAQQDNALTLGGTQVSPITWSATQIIGTIPQDGQTGSVVASISQVNSNAVAFTVLTPATPTISALTPNSGGEGTQVSISGQNLLSSIGDNFIITFNGVAAPLLSISDTAIVTRVPFGATTGPVLVNVNGTATNTLPFTVPVPPHIVSLSPTTGFYGDVVTIQGTNFGATQGDSKVRFVNVFATPTSWSDTVIIAPVPNGAIGGAVTVTVANKVSNSRLFTIPFRSIRSGEPDPPSSAVTITPDLVSKLVGEDFQLALIDNFGDPVTGATWTVNDGNLVSASQSDPPVFTALAVGQTTITATKGSLLATADVRIYSGTILPAGTTTFSVAPAMGGEIKRIVQGIAGEPEDADLFLLETDVAGATYVRGLDHNGIQKWLSPTGLGFYFFGQPAADGLGGMISATFNSVSGVRAGQVVWRSDKTFDTPFAQGYFDYLYAVHPNGTVYLTEQDSDTEAYITAIDGSSGDRKFRVRLPNNTSLHVLPFGLPCPGPVVDYSEHLPKIGPPLIAPDGTFYIQLVTEEEVIVNFIVGPPCSLSLSHSWRVRNRLLRIAPDGTSSLLDLQTWFENIVGGGTFQNIPEVLPGQVVPDNGQGLLVSWKQSPPRADGDAYFKRIPDPAVSADGLSFTVPLFNPQEIVVGEDGRAFVQGVCDNGPDCNQNYLVAFDMDSGSTLWTYKSAQELVRLMAATADGGLVGKEGSFVDGPNQVFSLDASGNHNDVPLSPTPSNEISHSWYGTWEATGATGLEQIAQPPIPAAQASQWNGTGGNPSQNRMAIAPCPCLSQSTEGLSFAQGPSPQSVLGTNALTETQTTHVLVVGDRGLGDHNVGNLFNLSAQTLADSLSTSPNNLVITNRASTVQDFNSALTTNGQIEGSVTYFGHAGWGRVSGQPGLWNMLFVGETTGENTNLTPFNVDVLSNGQLGPNTAITLNGCNAGYGGPYSIAKSIANRLRRTVFAYEVGMFFSDDPNARWPSKTPPPGHTPIYMVPLSRSKKIPFIPVGPNPPNP